MKKISSFLVFCLSFLLLVTALVPAHGFNSYPRQVQLETMAMEIYLDDWQIPTSIEPVLMEGQWYLPVNELAPFMGFTASYDSSEGWLEINTGGPVQEAGISYWAAELARASYEAESLQAQQDSLKKRLEEEPQQVSRHVREYRDDIETRHDMEVFLQDYFGVFQGMPVDIRLRERDDSEFRLTLEISDYDRSRFERMNRRSLISWLEEMYDAILVLYDEEAQLEGTLASVNDERESILRFRSLYGVPGRLSVHMLNRDDDEDEDTLFSPSALQRLLLRELGDYNGVRFTYRVQGDYDNADLLIYPDQQDLSRYNDWSLAQRREYLMELAELTEEEAPDIYIYGRLVEEDSGRVREIFALENGGLYGWERDPSDWFDRYEMDRWRDDFDNDRYQQYWERDRWWQDGDWYETAARREVEDPAPERISFREQVQMMPLLLTIDGVPFNSQEKMFRRNPEIYVPAGELADALYLMLRVQEDTGQMVFGMNPAAYPSEQLTMVHQLRSKESELETLRREVSSLLKEVEEMEERPIIRPYERITSIGEMERYLENRYGNFMGVYTEVYLSRLRDQRYRLRVWVADEDFDEFDGISQRSIERWVADMQAAIREMYDEKAEVEGSIRSDGEEEDDRVMISFRQRGGRLDFDFDEHSGAGHRRDLDLEKLLRELRRNIRRFAGRSFTYEGDLMRRDVELRIVTSESRFMDLSPEDQSDYLHELMDEIYAVYPGISVDGLIQHSSQASPFFRFSIENGNIFSEDLMQSLEDDLNRYERDFNGLRFEFAINRQHDGDIRLRLDGGFTRDSDAWQNVDATAFNQWLEDLKDRAEDVLMLNVTTQLRDSNGRRLEL
ncbi:hypothetical protein SAMN05192551_10390 [Tindallia magadiensis]|uniref:Copper amine oxidase N-terminal domain-containing protein n=1 Tax=Tindallia magadiensis TaxID=69895 RepID=A0A1I3D034_9FIRM|nr:hypothetical protein [Tindallia magadiensis]SFH79996.1 hypothetical protein SAMN05192551_10390 [Tindallia magadiensis]